MLHPANDKKKKKKLDLQRSRKIIRTKKLNRCTFKDDIDVKISQKLRSAIMNIFKDLMEKLNTINKHMKKLGREIKISFKTTK